MTGSGGVHLQYTDGGELTRVTFGNESSGADVSALSTDADDLKDHPSPHVRVTRDGADVTLTTDDGEVRWNSATRQSVMSWRWKDLHPPTGSIGHGVGEYSRAKLTPKQESLFASEVETLIENGWLVPHDEAVHGVPSCVLPLLAQVQEHKPSTPVRPCLDYRSLNAHLVSQPGTEAQDCGDTLRKWRCLGDPSDFSLIDIKKAYLQVHVAPELQKYQVVLWAGRTYVMTRMGFGLSVAPKLMDVVIRWITQRFSQVDNYMDDIVTPTTTASAVAGRLAEFGLPTKPPEPLTLSRALGLQLGVDSDGEVW